MRVVLAMSVVVCGCHDAPGEDAAIDAPPMVFDPCTTAQGLTLLDPFHCKQGAFANLAVDGTWTFTGTLSHTYGSDMQEPYSGQIRLKRTDQDGCGLNVAFPATIMGDGLLAHATNTQAWSSFESPPGQHLWRHHVRLCVDENDALMYEEFTESYMSGLNLWHYRGTLMR
jgi:hypothetical protein